MNLEFTVKAGFIMHLYMNFLNLARGLSNVFLLACRLLVVPVCLIM